MGTLRSCSVILAMAWCFGTKAQAWEDHRWDNWYFGAGGGFTFANGTCEPLEGNAATSMNDYVITLSDKTTGALLLYTNGGMRTANGHELIPAAIFDNINLLSPHYIVERPSTASCYFFHLLPDTIDLVQDSTRLNAIEVDPLANGGNGAVLDQGISLGTYRGNLMCPIPSLSPDTTWLIASDRRDSLFYRYSITQEGIGPAAPCGTAGQLFDQPTGNMMKADRKGTKVGYYRTSQKLTLQRFTRATATLSDRIELSKDSFNFGNFEFSPDGEKLYVQVHYQGVSDTMPAIFQYDLGLWDVEAIEASRTAVAYALQFQSGWLQLGPDGKIYSALGAADSTRIAVFNNPNASGATCGFVPYSVALPEGITKADIGSSAICLWWPAEWPLVGVVEQHTPRLNLTLQPNPAHGEVAIALSGPNHTTGSMNVLDVTGRQVLHLSPSASSMIRLDVSGWTTGCYLVQHTTVHGQRTIAKLMVE